MCTACHHAGWNPSSYKPSYLNIRGKGITLYSLKKPAVEALQITCFVQLALDVATRLREDASQRLKKSMGFFPIEFAPHIQQATENFFQLHADLRLHQQTEASFEEYLSCVEKAQTKLTEFFIEHGKPLVHCSYTRKMIHEDFNRLSLEIFNEGSSSFGLICKEYSVSLTKGIETELEAALTGGIKMQEEAAKIDGIETEKVEPLIKSIEVELEGTLTECIKNEEAKTDGIETEEESLAKGFEEAIKAILTQGMEKEATKREEVEAEKKVVPLTSIQFALLQTEDPSAAQTNLGITKVMDYLTELGYRSVEAPNEGDLVVYFAGNTPQHIGYFAESGLVLSKWHPQKSYYQQHPLFLVQVPFGLSVTFMHRSEATYDGKTRLGM